MGMWIYADSHVDRVTPGGLGPFGPISLCVAVSAGWLASISAWFTLGYGRFLGEI
jgi:hypothetical protein